MLRVEEIYLQIELEPLEIAVKGRSFHQRNVGDELDFAFRRFPTVGDAECMVDGYL